MTKPKLRNQSGGFILLGALMAFLFLGVVGIAFALSQRNQIQEARNVLLGEDLESLRSWFELGHDCPRTMAINPGQCGTDFITIARIGSGTTAPLISFTSPNVYTTVGNYRVRATCTGSNPKTFIIEAQSVSENPAGSWKKLYPATTPVTCS
jgi:cbb3-type cytochrome oxidase subunit 3